MMEKFAGPAPKYEDFPFVTAEELKVLFTRVGEMSWPDDRQKCRQQTCDLAGHRHPEFTSEDGKALLKEHFGVESAKELRQPHWSFLMTSFGKVLCGEAFLARDAKGIPFVSRGVGVTPGQIKADVEVGGY